MNLLPLFVFWCLWYINFSSRAIFSPILPLIEDSLSLSHGKAGGLFTSFSIGGSLTLLAAGWFASSWGYKRTVVLGYLGIGLVFLAFQWADSYFSYHILFFLLGIAGGTYLPTILPIITETYDYRHWGKAIGIHDSAASFSIFAIPILMAYGLQFLSWKRLILILGIASLLLPIFFWKVSIEPKRELSQRKSSYLDLMKRKLIWIMIFLWILASASSIGIYTILPLYLVKERGFSFSFANTLFGISRAGGMVVPILTGFLVDRYGYRTILFFSLFTTGLSTIALSLSESLTLILITLILQATLSLVFFPVAFTTISKLTSISERSMALGIILATGGILGLGVTPFILGLTADYLNFQVGFRWLGVLTALASFLVNFLRE